MEIYHIPRDYNKTLEQQKKELKSQYTNFQYLMTDRNKIHFMAEGKEDGKFRIYSEKN